MDIFEKTFSENTDNFTVYVVEKNYCLNQGHKYFEQFYNTEHFINNNQNMIFRIAVILKYIQKNIPSITELVYQCFQESSPVSTAKIKETIIGINKLLSVTEHQAVGHNIINPLILEKKYIKNELIAQLISLHKESIIRPRIILIIDDNSFEKEKQDFSHYPDGINIHFISNSDTSKIYKIINSGADDIESFIDSFSRQCFSTCSKTEKDIIFNSEWNQKDIVHLYVPILLKARTNLLYDEKQEALASVSEIIDAIESKNKIDDLFMKSFEFISKIFRVYCNDYGGTDIIDAWKIADELDIDLLKAHVYRYGLLHPTLSRERQHELLQTAEKIFRKNNILDQAYYCRNNYLIQQFYTEKVSDIKFQALQEEALADVPGMIGMSIILNNVGVAHLYTGAYSEASQSFKKGLKYSKVRFVQKLGINSNLLITRSCGGEKIKSKELRCLLDEIFAKLGTDYLPFITANYIMNILFITIKHHPQLAKVFLAEYSIKQVLWNALTQNIMGTGSLSQQLTIFNNKYPYLGLTDLPVPSKRSFLYGKKKEFLIATGYNPIVFHAWI